MATSRSQNQAAVVGYECEFLDQVPEEYICRQCKHVAREPIIVDCCNETMCEACVQEMMEDKKPCSNCQKVPVKYIPNKIKNKILDLNVHCLNCQKVPVKFIPQNKIRSCKWTGQLQQLDEHLSDCEYVDTKCDQCQKSIQKRNNFMTTHLANECPEREFSCKYCNYKATYVLVTEVHFKNCKLYILNCPNGCGVHFERGELEDHINMCSLQKVECEFSYAGCEDEFIRGQQKDHMEQNTQKHLVLMSTATLRISQEQEQAFDQKLQEQKQAFEQNLQEQKQAFKQRTNRLKKKLTSATRSLNSEYILFISLSVLIFAYTAPVYFERVQTEIRKLNTSIDTFIGELNTSIDTINRSIRNIQTWIGNHDQRFSIDSEVTPVHISQDIEQQQEHEQQQGQEHEQQQEKEQKYEQQRQKQEQKWWKEWMRKYGGNMGGNIIHIAKGTAGVSIN